ncbi:hypothetical protein D3C85_1402740 [compost metagenome]
MGRRDLKAYASSLALAVNMMPMAEGPIRRRPGLRHVDMVRNRLEVVPVLGGQVATPNGGDISDLLDGLGMETTTPLEAADGYVVLEIDFGAPTTVGMIDLVDFLIKPASGGGGGGELDPLPDPIPPQYPWDPLRPDLIVQ